MPAMQEISRPQPHVPTTFERLTQGSTARAVQVEAFRQAQLDFAREGLVLVGSPEPLAQEPQSHTPSLIKRFALPTAAALSVISLACSPQAPQEPQVVGTRVVVAEPGVMATIQAGEAQQAATAFADRATATAEAKPTATPIGIGATIEKFGNPEIDSIGEKLANHQPVSEADILKWNEAVEKRANATTTAAKPETKPISLRESISAQLDTLVSSINSLSTSFNPKISRERFEQNKEGILSEIQRVKDLLATGDVDGARKIIYRTRQVGTTIELSGLITSIISLGDTAQEKFVPTELKQQHDSKDKYIKKTRVDPNIYPIYLSFIDFMVATDPSY